MFLEPIWFFGLLLLGLVPMILGFIMRWPIIGLVTGGMWFLIFSMSDGLLAPSEASFTDLVYHNETSEIVVETDSYNYGASSGATDVNSLTRIAVAEYASTGSSLLVGDQVNCMDVGLSKALLPSDPVDDVIAGVMGATANVVYTFGSIDETTLTGSHTIYTFCNNASVYTIATGDRIGVKFDFSDGVNKVQTRTDAAGSFDGTVTFLQTYTTLWTSSTANDMTMRIYLNSTETVVTPVVDSGGYWVFSADDDGSNQSFTPEIRLLLSLTASLMCIMSGVAQYAWKP